MTFETNGFYFEIIIKFFAFYGFLFLFSKTKLIKIDNKINEPSYQINLNFSQFQPKYKVVALYYLDNYANENYIVKINNSLKYNDSLIEQQVKLSKMHGIYGFGLVFNWKTDIRINDIASNTISLINKENFPFFVILKYDLIYESYIQNSLKLNSSYNLKLSELIIDDFKNYLSLDNYIKIKNTPILGIFHSSVFISQLINNIRKSEFRQNKRRILIISIFEDNQIVEYLNITSDFFIRFPSQNIGLQSNLNQQYFYNFYNDNLFKGKIINPKEINNFCIVNGSPPEKFYLMFKKYLNETIKYNDTFIIFNAWNNYQGNYYLEPYDEYGYSYLNYYSKAIFDLEDKQVYKLKALRSKSKIAIQVHLFYEDLIEEIINKTNNIPVKFDLYISIISDNIYHKLESIIKCFSKANYYEIIIVENKGRDVLPFLNQMKTKFKYYKYICHIHSKKSKSVPELGLLWRNYLYNNLLGNENVVSEILSDFENKKKLGFIFPETFFGIINSFFILTYETKKWINFLSSKLFIDYNIGELSNFPAGNMFWAKIKSIYQIFLYDFTEYFPNEDNQINDTIMHAIERIWLYLVKFNHFDYKYIFKFF